MFFRISGKLYQTIRPHIPKNGNLYVRLYVTPISRKYKCLQINHIVDVAFSISGWKILWTCNIKCPSGPYLICSKNNNSFAGKHDERMYKNPRKDVKRNERGISRAHNTGWSRTKQKEALWQIHVREYQCYKYREQERIIILVYVRGKNMNRNDKKQANRHFWGQLKDDITLR